MSWRYQAMGEVARWLPGTGGKRNDAVVVFTQGHLGDVLHAAPMLRRLREARPEWKIAWLVGPWALPLAERFSAFADEIVPFASDSFCHHRGVQEHRQSAWEQWRIGLRLRTMRPKAFLCTGNESPVARYLANVSEAETWSGIGERRPPRVGKNIRTCFFPYEKERYEADALMQLLRPLGIEVPPSGAELFFPVDGASRRKAEDFLRREAVATDRPLVLVSPGSGWSGKNWPIGRFREVAAWLEGERGAQVAWIGSAGEAALAGDGPLPGKNWFGRFSIPGLAAVMERAALWVGNDSGPMHLAAAVGCPTVSLWGPTEPGKWAPRGEKHRRFRRMERCPGCEYWNPAKTCFQKTHACMEAVSVGEVRGAIAAALAAERRA
ncbi:MAG: glycosyltransferase family 9 protein [Kiritimatiellae bacterium]|nr:glycosyltransferase family 9 protein [Kiritimatiellia bacterium]